MQRGRRSAAAWALVAAVAACGDGGRTAGAPDAAAAAVAEEEALPPIDSALARELPDGVTVAMVEAGRRAFRGVCAPCHGPAAEGTQLGPALTDTVWIHGAGGYDEIVAVVRDGVPQPEQYPIPMPVLGGGDFGDDELRAVAAYVYALRFGVR